MSTPLSSALPEVPMRWSVKDVASVAQGQLLNPALADGIAINAVITDSRTVATGQLFVALRGEIHDAHNFLAESQQGGAAALLICRPESLPDGLLNKIPVIVVDDTDESLLLLAAAWRRRFDLPVIAITGSNGKTTCKEMIGQILRLYFGKVLTTPGNLNNAVGLPLTLLGLDGERRAAIVELGMNHPGEIARLAMVAMPDVALVTNAQRAHLERMGSVAAVAREKGLLYDALQGQDGVAIINLDDPHADMWLQQNRTAGRRIAGFSLHDQSADYYAVASTRNGNTHLDIQTINGRAQLLLLPPGSHNAANALAAIASAQSIGVPLEVCIEALASFVGVPGRLQTRRMKNGALLLEDTYNANPESFRAAIDVLSATAGQKVVVMGDMAETGDAAAQYHDEIGGYAKSQGVDRLLALGDLARLAAHNFGEGGQSFDSPEDIAAALSREVSSESTVLVKGSRFMRMERVVDALAAVAAAPGNVTESN